MKTFRWLSGAVVLVGVVTCILLWPSDSLIHPDLPLTDFYARAIFILILASVLCLYRIGRGPTGADRIVAVDILGIMIVGFCAVLTVTTGRPWYIDIAIAWALQSFISTLALSKYLEGKGFDE